VGYKLFNLTSKKNYQGMFIRWKTTVVVGSISTVSNRW